jgi:hypothetical protein
MKKDVIKQENRKQFPGNKNFESIIITKSEDVGYTRETYYDIRVFNSDCEENLYPTKKGLTISARTLKRITLFLIGDLLGAQIAKDWETDLPIKEKIVKKRERRKRAQN